jgi:hypothetical protein
MNAIHELNADTDEDTCDLELNCLYGLIRLNPNICQLENGPILSYNSINPYNVKLERLDSIYNTAERALHIAIDYIVIKSDGASSNT